MNVLVFISHPAQFHFYKYIITNLKNDGHNVCILIKTKDVLENLVNEAGWNYINIQTRVRKNNKLSMATASVRRTWHLLMVAKKSCADVLMGTDSSVAQAAKLLNKVSITTLEDDAEIIPKLVKVTYPFSTMILVPEVCSVGKWKSKKIGYNGYMKLAYLHPNYFIPQHSIVNKYIANCPYCLIRLAKLTAHHDEGIMGLSIEEVERLVDIVEGKGYSVYIHSEIPLSKKLQKHHLKIASSDIHHILYYSSLLVSDSQSMSMEAAMLGVPSVRFSDFSGKISVLEELQQKYKLTIGIPCSDQERLYGTVSELLSMPNLGEEFQSRRFKMLADKIDVTAFFTWFIENYPESKRIMEENHDYQYKFR